MSIKLDVGCGNKKVEGFVGIDINNEPDVDIVHDINMTPWPIEGDMCSVINASHVLEHLKPWRIFDVFNEMHRIARPGCQLLIKVPDGSKLEFMYDPSHIIHWTPESFFYFCDNMAGRQFWNVYKPLPWKMHEGFPVMGGYPAEITALLIK